MPRRNRYANREPSVAELLADPIAEALMRADGITAADVLAWIDGRPGRCLPSHAMVAASTPLAALPGGAAVRKSALPLQASESRMTGTAA